MARISVIIPVYNVEKYLSTCLDSVRGQGVKDLEIICIDDGSTDDSYKILQKYAQKDARIRVIHQENHGQAYARNQGIKKATGKYITFVDADDSLPPYALKILLQIAETTAVPIVMSENRLATSTNKHAPIQWQMHNNVLYDFVNNKDIFSAVWNKLYLARLLKKNSFIEGIYFEDWPFLMILMAQVSKFVTTSIPCYVYREDNSSTTRSLFTQKKVDSYITGIKAVYQYFQKRKDLIYAQQRMAVALKMLIHKIYHSDDLELQKYALGQIQPLFTKEMIHLWSLPLKTLWRYWRLNKKIRAKI